MDRRRREVRHDVLDPCEQHVLRRYERRMARDRLDLRLYVHIQRTRLQTQVARRARHDAHAARRAFQHRDVLGLDHHRARRTRDHVFLRHIRARRRRHRAVQLHQVHRDRIEARHRDVVHVVQIQAVRFRTCTDLVHVHFQRVDRRTVVACTCFRVDPQRSCDHLEVRIARVDHVACDQAHVTRTGVDQRQRQIVRRRRLTCRIQVRVHFDAHVAVRRSRLRPVRHGHDARRHHLDRAARAVRRHVCVLDQALPGIQADRARRAHQVRGQRDVAHRRVRAQQHVAARRDRAGRKRLETARLDHHNQRITHAQIRLHRVRRVRDHRAHARRRHTFHRDLGRLADHQAVRLDLVPAARARIAGHLAHRRTDVVVRFPERTVHVDFQLVCCDVDVRVRAVFSVHHVACDQAHVCARAHLAQRQIARACVVADVAVHRDRQRTVRHRDRCRLDVDRAASGRHHVAVHVLHDFRHRQQRDRTRTTVQLRIQRQRRARVQAHVAQADRAHATAHRRPSVHQDRRACIQHDRPVIRRRQVFLRVVHRCRRGIRRDPVHRRHHRVHGHRVRLGEEDPARGGEGRKVHHLDIDGVGARTDADTRGHQEARGRDVGGRIDRHVVDGARSRDQRDGTHGGADRIDGGEIDAAGGRVADIAAIRRGHGTRGHDDVASKRADFDRLAVEGSSDVRVLSDAGARKDTHVTAIAADDVVQRDCTGSRFEQNVAVRGAGRRYRSRGRDARQIARRHRHHKVTRRRHVVLRRAVRRRRRRTVCTNTIHVDRRRLAKLQTRRLRHEQTEVAGRCRKTIHRRRDRVVRSADRARRHVRRRDREFIRGHVDIGVPGHAGIRQRRSNDLHIAGRADRTQRHRARHVVANVARARRCFGAVGHRDRTRFHVDRAGHGRRQIAIRFLRQQTAHEHSDVAGAAVDGRVQRRRTRHVQTHVTRARRRDAAGHGRTSVDRQVSARRQNDRAVGARGEVFLRVVHRCRRGIRRDPVHRRHHRVHGHRVRLGEEDPARGGEGRKVHHLDIDGVGARTDADTRGHQEARGRDVGGRIDRHVVDGARSRDQRDGTHGGADRIDGGEIDAAGGRVADIAAIRRGHGTRGHDDVASKRADFDRLAVEGSSDVRVLSDAGARKDTHVTAIAADDVVQRDCTGSRFEQNVAVRGAGRRYRSRGRDARQIARRHRHHKVTRRRHVVLRRAVRRRRRRTVCTNTIHVDRRRLAKLQTRRLRHEQTEVAGRCRKTIHRRRDRVVRSADRARRHVRRRDREFIRGHVDIGVPGHAGVRQRRSNDLHVAGRADRTQRHRARHVVANVARARIHFRVVRHDYGGRVDVDAACRRRDVTRHRLRERARGDERSVAGAGINRRGDRERVGRAQQHVAATRRRDRVLNAQCSRRREAGAQNERIVGAARAARDRRVGSADAGRHGIGCDAIDGDRGDRTDGQAVRLLEKDPAVVGGDTKRGAGERQCRAGCADARRGVEANAVGRDARRRLRGGPGDGAGCRFHGYGTSPRRQARERDGTVCDEALIAVVAPR